MRVSEVTRLLITDLDSGRMVIRVDQGKGRKDRYVMLSQSLLETLRAYCRESKPKVFLFPGVDGKKPLCISAAQKAFDRARLQAGIKKPVSFHTLRHGFSTSRADRLAYNPHTARICGSVQLGCSRSRPTSPASSTTSRSRLREQPCTLKPVRWTDVDTVSRG